MSPLRCPTCRAPWRGATVCARCGTDLEPWITVLHAARTQREQARIRFLAGDYSSACVAALRAWRLQHTEDGRRLLILCLLATGRVTSARKLLGEG